MPPTDGDTTLTGRGFLSRLRTIGLKLLLLTLPALIICWLGAEVVFRWVIPASEEPSHRWDSTWAIVRLDGGQRDGTWTGGARAQQRGRWHINDAGWNSEVDYVPAAQRDPDKPLVAIIGDSYVEALRVDVDKSFVADVRRRAGDRFDVYSFGVGGATLAQYLQMSRMVREVYDPDVLVFVVEHNDFYPSVTAYAPWPEFLTVTPSGDTFKEVPPAPYEGKSTFKRLLAHSAVVRYLVYNARLRTALWSLRHRGEPVEANVEVNVVSANSGLIADVTDYLVATIRRENPDVPILFVMDAPRGEIYDGTLDEPGSVHWLNRVLEKAAAKHDCGYLDLTPVFEQAYAGNGRRFESQWDNHWDVYGNKVVAGALYPRLVEAFDAADGGAAP